MNIKKIYDWSFVLFFSSRQTKNNKKYINKITSKWKLCNYKRFIVRVRKWTSKCYSVLYWLNRRFIVKSDIRSEKLTQRLIDVFFKKIFCLIPFSVQSSLWIVPIVFSEEIICVLDINFILLIIKRMYIMHNKVLLVIFLTFSNCVNMITEIFCFHLMLLCERI